MDEKKPIFLKMILKIAWCLEPGEILDIFRKVSIHHFKGVPPSLSQRSVEPFRKDGILKIGRFMLW